MGYWPFRHCYEEGLRRDQKMTGKVSLDLTVAPGGSVDAATIAGSTLHDESVVLCVAREAQHLALASGESSAAAKLSVTLATGDEPVPMPRPAPHAEDLREGPACVVAGGAAVLRERARRSTRMRAAASS